MSYNGSTPTLKFVYEIQFVIKKIFSKRTQKTIKEKAGKQLGLSLKEITEKDLRLRR